MDCSFQNIVQFSFRIFYTYYIVQDWTAINTTYYLTWTAENFSNIDERGVMFNESLNGSPASEVVE